MRWIVELGLALVLGAGVARGQVVGANAVLPVPAPRADVGRWVDGPGRTRVELDADGAKLRGWEYRTPGSAAHRNAPVAIFFNGNLMTLAMSEELYRRLSSQGMDVVVYDYRGYGFSEGAPDVSAFRRDALLIYDKTAKQYAGRKVFLYGFSLGTAMAAYVASERKVSGVVLAAPFATAEKELPVFARRMGFSSEAIRGLEPAEDAKAAFNEVGMMSRSEAPLLVLSGSADTLVPAEQGREVLEASPAKEKKFVELHGVQHYETVFVETALKAVRTFLGGIS